MKTGARIDRALFYLSRPLGWVGKPVFVLSKEHLALRFDGPALKEHTMDVALFGPALTALGELCKEANLVINGERSAVRVMINADIEGNCVTVQLQVIQTVWAGIKDLAENRNAASAKNLLEWLGLLGVPATGSLITFLLRKKDRPAEVVSRVVQKDGSNLIEIRIQGDNNTVLITPEVVKLAESPAIVNAVKKLVEPVSEENGITEATFYQRGEESVTIDQNAAADLRKVTPQEKTEISTFTAHITVYAPVLDAKSKKWRFLMNHEHPYMDISETTIAADTMKRGGVRTGDAYTVTIEKTERTGKEPEYKIKKVLDFRPGQNSEQGSLL